MCCPLSFSRARSSPSVLRKRSISCLLLLLIARCPRSSVSGHVRVSDRVLRAGERHHGHRGGFHCQRGKVLGLEAVHVGLAARSRHHLALQRQRMEEIVDTLSRIVGIEPPAQHRILRGDPDWAATGMAVITIAGGDSNRALEVSLWNILVAIERNQGSGT